MNRAIRYVRPMSVVLAALLLAALMAVPASAAPKRALTVTRDGTGAGTVTSSPAGINCGATCVFSFNQGTVVTLTAAPDVNSTFAGWTGGGCSGTGTCVVTMNSPTTVNATFDPIPRTVTVGKVGTGTGTVTSIPAGIDCGATCSAQFPQGSTVTLTATPDVSSTFTGWSGACAGTGSCVLAMSANRSVTATFTIRSHALTVTKAGTGGGTVTSSPAGINCGASCSAGFTHGTVVTLTATPDANSTFAGWSGAGCAGTGTCVVTMTSATSVTATFAAITHQLSVTKAGNGTGTVTSSPPGIDCGATCSAGFSQGSSVDLTATPDPSSIFAGWSGSGCGGTGTCTVAITTAKSVTATFTLKTYQLSVSKAGTGAGVVTSDVGGINCGATCSASYDHGTVVTMTAAPDANSTFAGWSGGGCSGTGTCVVTMTAATSITATLDAIVHGVDVTLSGTGSGSVSSSPAGIDCGATCTAGFNQGSTVTLTATADPHSTFTGWSGSGCSGTGPCVLTVNSAKFVDAGFTLKSYPLTVTLAGSGGGVVTSDVGTIDCGVSCSDDYDALTDVVLTAAPDVNSVFAGWSGDCSGTGTCQLSMDGAKAATATFILKSFDLTVGKAGSGQGTVTSDIGAIDCGAICSDTYDALEVVTLTAIPDVNSVFAGWSGDCSGMGTCPLSMDGDKSVTATFDPILHDVVVATTGAGGGTVTSSPAGIDCGATCTWPFNQGATVTLSAVADPGSLFTGWSGDCSGIGDCVLDLDGSHDVSANFNGPRRPDGLVGVAGRPLKGAGIFNLTGAGQTQAGAVKAGRKRTYTIIVRNLGSQADAFIIVGEGGKSPFRVSYLVEGINITGQIVAGTYRSPSLWSQEWLTIQVVVKAKKGAKKGSSESWLVTTTSVNDPAKADAVKVTTTVRR